ncbi:cysteine-rich KTR domain-containing protein [Photobacterium damselae]|nr:cysteine-rich KTR domain-containing protein [Photobacterium damselae]
MNYKWILCPVCGNKTRLKNRVGGGLTASVLSHHRTSVDRIRRFRIYFQ